MNKTVKISTAAIFIMFFMAISISAQKHTKASETGHQMMKNMQMDCDSTMMNKHKTMMKDGKMNCDSTMMKNHKAMMKDGKMMCDSTMMGNHKGMMMDKGNMMNHKKGMMQKHKGMMNHDKMMKNNNKMMGSSMIHKGVIDVNAIDVNKDGKVYQDVMDWNVISDKPGKCPNCGMTLKEVTIEQAIKNLKNNGYKTK